ncbi:hypothetical protein [Janthinobacterium sp. HLX7-2]|uniref:hypothetical protein n=1 Tax=Janthinobacterium sp. HLX7-2 TaxID=1259331 RepID=UPI003F2853E5
MSKTILIVEDEQAIADSIAYALRTDGFAPRHVMLGEQAWPCCVPAPATARKCPLSWCSTWACPI